MIAAFFGRIWAHMALVGSLVLALIAALAAIFWRGARMGRREDGANPTIEFLTSDL